MDIMQTREGNLTLYGGKTPRAVIYKHESHKLHQAFNVADNVTIVQGMPVALNSVGKIIAYTGAEGQVFIGYAVTDNVTPAYHAQREYPVEVTVAVEGYMICNYAAKGAITPGYVATDGTIYNNRYPNVTASNTETKMIALASAAAPSGGIAEIVPVLVR